ncbi:ATP-grasp domain-containing protein [Listeria sp. FSL L7-0229]|uniref:ATP-grasp domain-containing protein n=1 Tax=Listeria cossartiae TaxID=2838249 RepID=UPI001625CCD3|nr:ATP-grasp domain-containing protein [Listeria cossartiae]MBC2192909.1 ATP-grasp domain-containing protein [Listeria cossartiae subsp. cossartiae]
MHEELCVCLGRREEVLRAIKRRGLKTIVFVDKQMRPPNLNLCDYFFHLDNLADTEKIGMILAKFDKSKIKAIISPGEKGVRTAAELRDKLSIDGIGADKIERFRDKAVMKDILIEKNFRVANYIDVKESATGLKFLDEFVEVVAKPKQGMGSVGVKRIKTDEEWLEYYEGFKRENELYHFEKGILLEEYIQGEEYHIDSIIQDGKIKFSHASMYSMPLIDFKKFNFVGTITLDVNTPIFKELIEYNREILKALEVQNGVTHLECFKNDREICFCEIAIRPAGSAVPANLKIQTNVDIIDAFVAVELGEKFIPDIKIINGITGSLQIPIYKNGKITSLLNEKESDMKDIIKVDYLFDVGQSINTPNAAHERIGDIFIHANNLNEMIRKFKSIHLNFDTYVKVEEER